VDSRLVASPDNGKTGRYAYNAAGECIVKCHGDLEGVYVNGAHRELPFGYPRLRCKPSAKQTSLLCTRLARKFHETEDYTFYPAPIITVVKNRFIKHGLLMLAMLGVAYAIAVKGRAFVALNHFCLLQNINNKYKNT